MRPRLRVIRSTVSVGGQGKSGRSARRVTWPCRAVQTATASAKGSVLEERPAAHAGAEAVDEGLERVQALPTAGDLGGRGFRLGVGPAEEDAVARRFAHAEVHIGGAAREQRLDRVLVLRDGVGDPLVELRDRLQDDRFDDRVPVGEVRVDRGGGDADLPGDGAQGDGLVGAGAHDQGGGRAEDLLTQEQALPAPVPRPGEASSPWSVA